MFEHNAHSSNQSPSSPCTSSRPQSAAAAALSTRTATPSAPTPAARTCAFGMMRVCTNIIFHENVHGSKMRDQRREENRAREEAPPKKGVIMEDENYGRKRTFVKFSSSNVVITISNGEKESYHFCRCNAKGSLETELVDEEAAPLSDGGGGNGTKAPLLLLLLLLASSSCFSALAASLFAVPKALSKA